MTLFISGGFRSRGSEGDGSDEEEEAVLAPLPDVSTKFEGKKGVAIPIKSTSG